MLGISYAHAGHLLIRQTYTQAHKLLEYDISLVMFGLLGTNHHAFTYNLRVYQLDMSYALNRVKMTHMQGHHLAIVLSAHPSTDHVEFTFL